MAIIEIDISLRNTRYSIEIPENLYEIYKKRIDVINKLLPVLSKGDKNKELEKQYNDYSNTLKTYLENKLKAENPNLNLIDY